MQNKLYETIISIWTIILSIPIMKMTEEEKEEEDMTEVILYTKT